MKSLSDLMGSEAKATRLLKGFEQQFWQEATNADFLDGEGDVDAEYVVYDGEGREFSLSVIIEHGGDDMTLYLFIDGEEVEFAEYQEVYDECQRVYNNEWEANHRYEFDPYEYWEDRYDYDRNER